MSEFRSTLRRLIAISGKSINEIAYLGGLDPAYLRRLVSGEKTNPSPETLVKIWIGIIMDTRPVARYPTFTEGLAELMSSAGLSRIASLN